ncbi:MAG: cation-translocating P-type ATPase [bacterium]
MEKYYKEKSSVVLTTLKTSENGLSTNEVNKRLEENGTNILKEENKKSPFIKFISQFKDPMIIILAVACILSYFVSKSHGESQVEAIVIAIIIFLNAGLSFIQEMKAEKSIEALSKMSTAFVNVKRDGKFSSVNVENLVVGDIIHLEAGDYIPADVRFLKVNSFKTEEAALTGESEPVTKISEPLTNENVPLALRLNIGYSGSSVLYGNAEAVVIATGMNTELGKIAGAINSIEEEITPLQEKINEITKIISIVVVIVALITFFTELIKGSDITSILMISISLAVAGIPEGLMSVITITLSSGVQSLAKEKSIIRKLSSVETLGSAQIICTDKTGTLTQNKMTVKKIYLNKEIYSTVPDDSNEFNLFLKIGTLCNNTKINGKELLGDPTETAIVSYAINAGYDLDYLNVVKEYPFDSDRKMMSVISEDGKEYFISVKGALESVIKNCTHKLINGKVTKITKEDKEKIISEHDELTSDAYRVLGLAYKISNKKTHSQSECESDLIFVGMAAMIDPPRDEVKNAVKECFSAGIIPVMITGDNINTAKAIAKELGIYKRNNLAITGDMLNNMSDDQLKEKVYNIRVYARVTPQDKMRIVNAFKSLDMVVAMTGDGVNDAPALKGADIGIGMGITGTEVSKSVSSMVLADDNFATIIKAVEEGRRIYKNIQNVVIYLLATNITEVFVIFTSTLLGINIFTPLQILWINLVTDTIPAIALGLEAGDSSSMKQKPRDSKESFFTPVLKRRILVAAFIKIVLILCLYFTIEIGFDHESARGAVFIMLVFMELIFAISCRSEDKFSLSVPVFKNVWLVYAILFTGLLQVILIRNSYLSAIFSIPAIEFSVLLIVIIYLILSFVFFEVSKLMIADKFKAEK